MCSNLYRFPLTFSTFITSRQMKLSSWSSWIEVVFGWIEVVVGWIEIMVGWIEVVFDSTELEIRFNRGCNPLQATL